VAAQFMAPSHNIMQVLLGKNAADWRIGIHKTEGGIICSCDTIFLEEGTSPMQSRAWKVVKAERDYRGSVNHANGTPPKEKRATVSQMTAQMTEPRNGSGRKHQANTHL
jgi:hypothetical protein